MSLAGDLRNLRQLRQREMEMLSDRILTIADAFECEPAKWVGEHPYLAMSGAALIGFAAANFPRKAPPAAAAAPRQAAAPSYEAAPPREAAESSKTADIVALLVQFAGHFLQPEAAAVEPSLTVADAGAIGGGTFPEIFSTRPARTASPSGKI